MGPVVRSLPIFVSISALGNANGALFGAARYCMVGAQYGYLPDIFASIHIQRRTPLPSVIFQVVLSPCFQLLMMISFLLKGFLAILFCIPSDVGGLINFLSFAAWIFSALAFFATLCCKFTKKNAERVISVCIYP